MGLLVINLDGTIQIPKIGNVQVSGLIFKKNEAKYSEVSITIFFL